MIDGTLDNSSFKEAEIKNICLLLDVEHLTGHLKGTNYEKKILDFSNFNDVHYCVSDWLPGEHRR